MMSSKSLLFSLIVLVVSLHSIASFSVPPTKAVQARRLAILKNADLDDGESPAPVKLSLEEKMKAWEATEEEIKAASLGGVIPGRSDAFDVGLYIAFPLMVISGLLFAFFPVIMGNIDTSAVGPPPTM
jgi:hypothetical protein